jgi:hypothetical protein
MILILNKRDLFEAKIKVKPISDVPQFSDYTGGSNYDSGTAYFVKKFLERNQSPDRKIYHHITCATDTKNVHVVFEACKDIILRAQLLSGGSSFLM